jgi:hypothetical protein
MSNIFVLDKKNSVRKGVSWELKMFAKCKGGNVLAVPSPPRLNTRGAFKDGKQIDNYQLLSTTKISMKGFI